MKEKNTIHLLLILAIIGLIISAYSVFIQASTTPVLYKKYLLPIACIEQNNTYFLAQPTNPDFCDSLRNLDKNDLKKECNTLYGEDKSMCLSITDFYSRRTDDCLYPTDNILKSSVSKKEMESVCDRYNELLR